MEILIVLLIVIILLLVVVIFLGYKASQRKEDSRLNELKFNIDAIKAEFPRITAAIASEISTNRVEGNTALKQTREELTSSLRMFSEVVTRSIGTINESQKNQLESFAKNLHTLTQSIDEKLTSLTKTLEQKIEAMTTTLQTGLKFMQEGNEKKLDEMRKTVDEKLHDTLEKRLGESFRFVSERLEAVHKGLGDMQNLAANVGDLKRVMSNVKSRGVLGEYQLLNILEDLLTHDQYEKNVKTKEGSGALVEFAIKMPNGKDAQKSLWLPIDSKFPKEDYEALVAAYEEGDAENLDALRKAFRQGIIKNARDIREKYIDPPNTTEYGIMFLPFESLYAEVLRTPGLFEQIHKDYKITITGPTTLSALINSLQMGFRTLAIEKRSSEVWDLLGAVKTEFTAFGDVLDKTQKKLQEASNVIDKAGIRTRAIEKKLRKVQELPVDQSVKMIDEIEDSFSTDETGADT
ncbi:MAG TPA: DNA recombination protein RmuC [Puia sp.]|nr:DNA recombination protein RmuC [Puia sp.]